MLSCSSNIRITEPQTRKRQGPRFPAFLTLLVPAFSVVLVVLFVLLMLPMLADNEDLLSRFQDDDFDSVLVVLFVLHEHGYANTAFRWM